MKKSMQAVAMAAFLGCFGILVIAASGKTKLHENCGEEWKNNRLQEKKKSAALRTAIHASCMNRRNQDNKQEVILPVQVFHTIL